MLWPWQRSTSADLVAVSWCDQTLAFVRGRVREDGLCEVRKFGVVRQGADTGALASRLEALGLKGGPVRVMLRPHQYQWLQIDAPGVAPDELRAAARYQIRDMLDTHIDDVTLDVMRLGDGQHKGTQHLFVVAAANAALRASAELATTLRWTIPVIDVQETVQRNLQNALARREGILDRATAALVLTDEAQAVLTICANEELFYTRRLEVPPGFLDSDWGADQASEAVAAGFTPVDEYVPDYGVGGVAYGSDYSAPVAVSGNGAQAGHSAGAERAQRFLVEVQRSLDLWDRTWSSLPLAAVRVYAGERSVALAQWLTRELGQGVVPLTLDGIVDGFTGGSDEDRALCWPLLGLLMRSDTRKL
jgi:MSHA biogenesis protein MshI